MDVGRTADVDADSGRDDGAARRDHAADGCTDAGVYVGHGGHVRMHDRQVRNIQQLLDGRMINVIRIDVHRHQAFVQALLNWHNVFRYAGAVETKTPASFLAGVRVGRTTGSGG